MKVLFLGDICGRPGREALRDHLGGIKKKYDIDFTIANVENIAHGRGASVRTLNEISGYGVDFFTAGNHIWRSRDLDEIFDGRFPIIRNLNYPDDLPGKGYAEVDLGKLGLVLIVSVIGVEGMRERTISEPLRALDGFLSKVEYERYSAIIVEMHAESTGEKISCANLVDGRASAFIGNHTHVPTADQRLLPKGLAFISDVGAVSPLDASLWVQKDVAIQHMMNPYGSRFEIEENGPVRIDGVVIDIQSPVQGHSIQRINITL